MKYLLNMKIFLNIYYKIKGLKYSNYIKTELDIQENDINKEIKIISLDEPTGYQLVYGYFNSEERINNQINDKNIEIEIDNKIIPFNIKYRFDKKGKHIIKYYINNYVSNIKGIFGGCEKITKIEMTNFNTENIINMKCMFSGCKSLEDLSIINTQNVNNMNSMF